MGNRVSTPMVRYARRFAAVSPNADPVFRRSHHFIGFKLFGNLRWFHTRYAHLEYTPDNFGGWFIYDPFVFVFAQNGQ